MPFHYLFERLRNIPVRAWIIAMIFMTAFMSSTLASNISFIIDAMVVRSVRQEVPFCRKTADGSKWMDVEVPNLGPRHYWSDTAIWQIKIAYFYGIVIASPLAGILAERFGPKNTIFFPLLFAGVFNVLSAHGAKWGWIVPFVCRLIVGLASGTVYPALQCLVGRWAPPHEKGKFINAIMGDSIGTAVVWVMIRYSSPKLGWPWTFYILSIMITIYCAAFWLLTANNPEEHNFISEAEVIYIGDSQKGSVSLNKEFPPFKEIVTSSECWALAILNFGDLWGVQIQMQMVPKYIETYMGITANESVLLAILPNIARFCSGIFFGNLSDFIQSKNMINITTMSKIFVIFSHLLPGFILMSLGSLKCNAFAISMLLIVSNLFTGAAVASTLRNPTDLSPNYAGTIFGLNMCLGQTTGFIVPSLGSWILSYQSGIAGWTIIFLIGGGAYFGTGIIYLWFGTSELQSWNTKTGSRLMSRGTVYSRNSVMPRVTDF